MLGEGALLYLLCALCHFLFVIGNSLLMGFLRIEALVSSLFPCFSYFVMGVISGNLLVLHFMVISIVGV